MPLTHVDTTALVSRIRSRSAVAVRQTMNDIARDTAQDVPVLSGALRLSATRSESNGGLKQTLRYPVDYASHTDTGTRPHTIRPRSGKVLRFRVGGVTIFARSVNHPGTSGTRWFSDAVTPARMLARLNATLRRVLS